MKKLIAISAMTFTLLSCSPISHGATIQKNIEQYNTQGKNSKNFLVEFNKQQALKNQKRINWIRQQIRGNKIQHRISKLKNYVGNTWYVFAGSTPNGWDCSGLVLWFYSDFGIELEHSATKQKFSGVFTDNPMPGDIIAFSHPGNKSAYHNGIYIGNGLFIHSPRKGKQTKLSLVDDYIGKHSKVTYTRIDF